MTTIYICTESESPTDTSMTQNQNNTYNITDTPLWALDTSHNKTIQWLFHTKTLFTVTTFKFTNGTNETTPNYFVDAYFSKCHSSTTEI